MKFLPRMKKFVVVFLVAVMQFVFMPAQSVLAAPAKVDLLTASPFAVLAGQHITNVPTSAIVGNAGLSPASGSQIGLTQAQVNGTIYAVDAAGPGGSVNDPALLTQAKNDLTTAYLDAAGRTPATVLSGSDNQLGGQTLTAGIYSFGHATTANLTAASPLTLDGQGDSTSVFIFQASSDLVLASASVVQLTNGAQACNVFWQVTSSAVLGTGSRFVGSILALTDITDNGGSTVNGRLLARNNDVILNSTGITVPTCVSATTSPTTSSAGAPSSYCAPLDSNIVAPNIIESRRVSPTSIFLSWGPYSGTNTFNIHYGPTNGNWLYNTNVLGFSTTINNLPPNQSMWFQIAPSNNCTIGNYGPAKLVGGAATVPCQSTNPLTPCLPNTGFGPSVANVLGYFEAGVSAISSFFLRLLHI